MSAIFHEEANPTVLWTGNGYHIYQPMNGIVFEEYKTFYKFLPYLDGKDLTRVSEICRNILNRL